MARKLDKLGLGLIAAGLVSALGMNIYTNLPPSQEELAAMAQHQQREAEQLRQQEREQELRQKAWEVASKRMAEKAKANSDAVGEWAMRAHDVEQAHQDRCWDQLEARGYGDASCY